jgi:hypothetical protein
VRVLCEEWEGRAFETLDLEGDSERVGSLIGRAVARLKVYRTAPAVTF